MRRVVTMSTTHPEFFHISVGSMDNNCWLICMGGDALLIDAATDAPALLELAREHDVTITDVLTTHRHADHVQALAEVLQHTDARHHAPRLDAPALPSPADRTYGTDSGETQPLDLASSALNTLDLQVVELRGHTPGGLAVLHLDKQQPQAWVGDSVFPGGVGKTTSDKDFTQLLSDVEERIFTLPDNTLLHPGHGNSTTVGAEKPHVDEWRERGW
ncbi:MBL fold metallo-hydrolase [Corynebacterium sp. 320]|nr:MBL fold metallo-hydrolase [Corynebacterium sp. 320]KAB1551210.1 MBL fold metallo-hydrolase [Corynebacterium sp. 321]KAB1551962.1 MBL fold metallo-hydrolase [Corynebacterium sp. 319]KAB3526175.1 MBL fold metallo-hydrolase [Corynebacterium sp. 250]KAB3538956.1 MBL fold metallo-hydrolase [Corynebacterium sp. 366]QNP92910.1 MBL fold metallo-hydrolase [Corynebacterium zhongnanshanii]